MATLGRCGRSTGRSSTASACCWPTTSATPGKTFERAKAVIEEAGGTVIATVEICDRLEAIVDLGVPNFALAEYRAPENFPAADCPLCKAGTPITTF